MSATALKLFVERANGYLYTYMGWRYIIGLTTGLRKGCICLLLSISSIREEKTIDWSFISAFVIINENTILQQYNYKSITSFDRY